MAITNKRLTWPEKSLWCAQIFLWAMLFCLPFSHFLVNQFVFLSAIFVLLSGCYKEKWLRLKQYKSVLWILLFILMVGLSITYSSATVSKAFSFFNKYTKLLYIIFLLHICQTEKRRQISLNVLLCGITIATILAFLYSIHLADYSFTTRWPKIFARSGIDGLFINILHFSVLQSFALYLLLVRIFKKQSLSLSIVLFVLISFDLFYFNTERTGCLAAVALIYLAMFQYLLKSKIKFFTAISIATILSLVIIFTSPGFLSKLRLASSEVKNYSVAVAVPDNSLALGSVGLRLEFIKGSLRIMKKNPWFGTGVGSFATEYNRTGAALMPDRKELWDPHNAFLMIGVQMGIVGLLLFALLLLMLLRDIHRLPFYETCIGYAIGLLFVINSLLNATLIDNTVGYLYVTLTAILLSSLPHLKKKSRDLKS